MTSQDDTEDETPLMTKAEFRARLKAIGCTDGVSLCQELLDVFLTSGKEKVTE